MNGPPESQSRLRTPDAIGFRENEIFYLVKKVVKYYCGSHLSTFQRTQPCKNAYVLNEKSLIQKQSFLKSHEQANSSDNPVLYPDLEAAYVWL